MKINRNIPIFAILTIFVSSNAFLYRYLGNNYFVDKKPTVKELEVDSIIFKLIAEHEKVLQIRNNEILLEAERLKNQRANITDSEELKAIEEKLRALEEEARRVQDKVRSSESERDIAQRKSESDLLQLTELMESNSRMGAQLESISNEFENYVSTLENTLVSKSSSDVESESINKAFQNRKGLNYLNNLIGNIQGNRTALVSEYEQLLKKRSESYTSGLKEIAKGFGDNNYIEINDPNGLINSEKSVNKLIRNLDRFIADKDLTFERLLAERLGIQETLLKQEFENKLAELASLEEAKRLSELSDAEKNKNLSLAELERRLREELAKETEKVIEFRAAADTPVYTSWIHIPGLWESSKSTIAYSGKKVDSIAWSRQVIKNNQTITFHGEFSPGGELIVILYGNGRFKSWDQGLIMTIADYGGSRGSINLIRNGIGESSETILEETVSLERGISGDYYIAISGGTLTMSINGITLLDGFKITEELSGRLGFGNRESNSNPYTLSNIKLFKIQ